MAVTELPSYWVNMFWSWSLWLCLFLVTRFFCPWGFWKKTWIFELTRGSFISKHSIYSAIQKQNFIHLWYENIMKKPQFYITWVRQMMATNPSVTAEEDQSLMVRFSAGVQETLSCVPFWSSKSKKDVARLERVKRRTMKIIKGMDNGGREEKLN